jgi:predicted ATPase/class 3 adenylate cyclase
MLTDAVLGRYGECGITENRSMDGESSFGYWIRRRRKALDLTQEELAERIGCALDTIRKIESGARRPSRQVAERLATQLDVPEAMRTAFLHAARAELAAARLAQPPVPAPILPIAPSGDGQYSVVAPALPCGTITFLCTDIVGSTQRWEQHPDAMRIALARHDALLRQTVAAHDGVVFKSGGDGVFAAFARAPDALAAAVAAQQALLAERWEVTSPLHVRMVLHTGIAEERDGNYFGPPLHRAARLLAVGHGDQILLSRATQELICDALPSDIRLQDLGTHRLKDLIRPEHIFQVVAPHLPTDFPPLRSLDIRPHNLPAQLTPLIGRLEEITEVCDRLRGDSVRLLTLTGPGGTGKTRLALQVAAELLDDFADGVFFVDLAPMSDPALVGSTIAATLGVQENGEQPLLERLKAYLHSKQLLLFLDNFEQIVEAAPLVEELLVAAANVKVLITSREVLHLYGEHEFTVPPLAVPDLTRLPPLDRLSQYDAVRLFIERAQAAKSDFMVTNANAPTAAEICHRLDGLPLAIELAAARSKLFAPDALLARLNNRLQVLTGGARTLPVRQQTLRNTIAWSYELLDTSEQILFARLGVFVGGCTLEAAEAICNTDDDLGIAVLDGLAALIDKSMLRQEQREAGEQGFTMFETIREYALEQIAARGELAEMQRYHATYYSKLAERAELALGGAQQTAWYARLEIENDNIRAALRWALAHDALHMAMQLGGSLGQFWHIHSHISEGRHWLEQLLARASATPSLPHAKLLFWDGVLAQAQCDYAQASKRFEESLALRRQAGDRLGMAGALSRLGMVAQVRDDPGKARRLFEESLALNRELGNTRGTGWEVLHLGELSLLWNHGPAAAQAQFEESLNNLRAVEDTFGIALALRSLGDVHFYAEGNLVAARTRYEESLKLIKELGDRWGIGEAYQILALVALEQNELGQAAGHLTASLECARELGDSWGIIVCIDGFARLAQAHGRLEQAARLFSAAESLSSSMKRCFTPVERAIIERHIAELHLQLDPVAFNSAWVAGQALSREQAVGEALTLSAAL